MRLSADESRRPTATPQSHNHGSAPQPGRPHHRQWINQRARDPWVYIRAGYDLLSAYLVGSTSADQATRSALIEPFLLTRRRPYTASAAGGDPISFCAEASRSTSLEHAWLRSLFSVGKRRAPNLELHYLTACSGPRYYEAKCMFQNLHLHLQAPFRLTISERGLPDHHLHPSRPVDACIKLVRQRGTSSKLNCNGGRKNSAQCTAASRVQHCCSML
ncbi:hypothetical protein GGR56DRAFT_84611 [Xylariaceae sp. FL0804]|nr:hypothetical protein GGR56DRAFT_84611 [Xylariaceae sp. FL0804]